MSGIELLGALGTGLLVELVVSNSLDLIATGVIKLTDGLCGFAPFANGINKETRDAAIRARFGDSFPGQLIEIKKLIDAGLKETQKLIERLHLLISVRGEYERDQAVLRAGEGFYEKFIKCPSVLNWTEFHNSAGNTYAAGDSLFQWVATEVAPHRGKLLDEVIGFCETVDEFDGWKRHISAAYGRACFLRIAYHYYRLYPDEAYINGPGLVVRSALATQLVDLDPTAREDLKTMAERQDTITKCLNEASVWMRTKFLRAPCGAPDHKSCCTDEKQPCTGIPLKSLVYGQLRDNSRLDNTKIADLIATELRGKYGHMEWSVMVLQDRHDAELYPNAAHAKDALILRFGKSKNGLEHDVIMDGLGLIGAALCYRRDERAALVFWHDRTTLVLSDTGSARRQLLGKWASDTAFKTAHSPKRQSVQKMMASLTEQGLDYLFGIRLKIKEVDKSIGSCLADNYPVRLWDGKSCTVTWPALLDTRETLDCRYELRQDQGQQLQPSGNGKYEITSFTGPTYQVGDSVSLAVKEFPLSMLREESERRTAALDGYYKLLCKLQHKNVVRFLGRKVHATDTKHKDTPTFYQLAMVLYPGGSLAKAVRESAPHPHMLRIANDILSGLSYLHSIAISHQDLHGDHLFFEGPQLGCGKIKIISVGRFAEIVHGVNRSNQRNATSAESTPFQPPEAKALFPRRGTKTDVYSFACVLIQMFTGQPPALTTVTREVNRKEEKVDKPVVIPPAMEVSPQYSKAAVSVIKTCLHLDYDQRPTIDAIIASRVFPLDV